MRKNDKKRIDEELVCIDSLAQALKGRFRCREVQLRREMNDPPDFWVNADSIMFAAEVTSIVTGQAYHASCRALKDAIRDSLNTQGGHRGNCALVLFGQPDLPHRSSEEWHALVTRSADFMQRAMHLE